MIKKSISILTTIFILASCATGPEPITYGHDGCAYCDMTIMDHRYGTEAVTDKGKIYKFDSIECLVRFLQEGSSQTSYKHVLLTPFTHPETFVEANRTFILHSQNMPSPMGMFLTAFRDEATAKKFQEEKGGKLYNWEDLLDQFEDLI